MPWWMSRLAWRCRRKRLVRVHLDAPAGSVDTLEGVRLGCWGGMVALMLAKAVETGDRSHQLDGVIEIPISRVVFVQVLS